MKRGLKIKNSNSLYRIRNSIFSYESYRNDLIEKANHK